MKRLQRQITALTLGACLLTSSVHGISLTLDNAPLDIGATPVYNNTTYVSLRLLTEKLCPDAQVSWENGRATVLQNGTTLTATPGESVLVLDGKEITLDLPVRLENDRTLVPIRPLAAVLDLDVNWNSSTEVVSLTARKTSPPVTSSKPSSSPTKPTATDSEPAKESPSYSQEDLYWLSRIISAESQGESWEGKIAVGNVVMNRVLSSDFPDTIYGVIFDDRWGGQFEPVRNGTIYNEPTAESVDAAIACLEGANTVGESLYFLAPDLTSNHWTMENRTYITTIGVHWFYK